MGDLTKDFSRSEFMCQCAICTKDQGSPSVKMDVVYALQDLRDHLKQPIVINAGVRCEAHNKALGGASDSRHLPAHADAVDIAYNGSEEAYKIVGWAFVDGRFRFIELASRHIHLDMRPGPARLIIGTDK